MFKWLQILSGALRSALRCQQELAAENLALRQQLAVLKHGHPRPRLTKTVLRWHRQGFRYYWRWKSRRRGRPKVDPEIRNLIRRMCRANPLWGAPRIHGELLKLGIDVSEATVSNHHRRRILHFNVTAHPMAAWTARQLLEACGFDETPRYLLRDRDAIYGQRFHRQAAALKIREIRTAPRSPWQNLYAERVIGSIRRECVDHVIVLGERQLRRILKKNSSLLI